MVAVVAYDLMVLVRHNIDDLRLPWWQIDRPASRRTQHNPSRVPVTQIRDPELRAPSVQSRDRGRVDLQLVASRVSFPEVVNEAKVA